MGVTPQPLSSLFLWRKKEVNMLQHFRGRKKHLFRPQKFTSGMGRFLSAHNSSLRPEFHPLDGKKKMGVVVYTFNAVAGEVEALLQEIR